MEGGFERQAVDDATMHRIVNHVVTNTVPCREQRPNTNPSHTQIRSQQSSIVNNQTGSVTHLISAIGSIRRSAKTCQYVADNILHEDNNSS